MSGWKKMFGSRVRATKTPAVFERREGGQLVRTRVTDASTGRPREIRKVLPTAPYEQAVAWLEERKRELRGENRLELTTGGVLVPATRRSKTRFASYAVSLAERLFATKIRTPAGRRNFKNHLEHLVAGTFETTGSGRAIKKGALLVRELGDIFVEELRRQHFLAWHRTVQEKLTDTGVYAPTTPNDWMTTLRYVLNHARLDLSLGPSFDPCARVEDFDTSEHEPYTVEQPNALTPAEMPVFLAHMKRLHPTHYAMTLTGFVTGLRPSNLRPLRRKGELADIGGRRACSSYAAVRPRATR